MRRCLGVLAVLCLAFSAIGCATIAGADPALVEATIQSVSETTVGLGLQSLAKDQATSDRIKADVAIVKKVIDTSILPLFTGQDLNKITLDTANQAIAMLDGKLSPQISGIIQTAIDGALLILKLPDNPTTAGLTDSQRNLIVALFKGINAGISDFTASARALSPPGKLAWKKGGSR